MIAILIDDSWESCDSGCTEGCDETCGDDDIETKWLAYVDKVRDPVADRMIESTRDFQSTYLHYNNDSKSHCTDDSYNIGLSLLVGFVHDDDSKTVFIDILQTNSQTFFYLSESDEVLTISNNSYFAAIELPCDYSDIESTDYFGSHKNVNISGCDWSTGFSMIFNQDTLGWVCMKYGFSYDNDDDEYSFVKESFNLTNVDTVTIDITDDVSSSNGLTQLIKNTNNNNNDNNELIL